MTEQLWNIGISKVFSYSAVGFLIVNLGYVFYAFMKKRIYYDNLLISFTIYFMALIVEPISASIKFNTKYGYEVIDLFYFGIIFYIIITAILRNNVFFMYNMTWEEFYSVIKEVFRRRGTDIYYRKPTIYFENEEASISHSFNLFSKKVIIVKYKNLSSVISLEELKKAMTEEKIEYQLPRFYYLVINLLLTAILLLNILF